MKSVAVSWPPLPARAINSNTGAVGRGLIETSAGTATLTGPITIDTDAAAGGHFASAGAAMLMVDSVITSSVPVTVQLGNVVFGGGGTGYTEMNAGGGTTSLGATNGIATSAVLDVGTYSAATFDSAGQTPTSMMERDSR